jgi:hypothetical protein
MARLTPRGYISTGGGDPRSKVKGKSKGNKSKAPRKGKKPKAPRTTPSESKEKKAPTAPKKYKTYIPSGDYTYDGGDSEPLIETSEECNPLTVSFASSTSIWFFAYCKSESCPDSGGWTFPAGYYLGKKCTVGALYYLSYLRRYQIDGKWHDFNGFVGGGGRMEQITNPHEFVADEFASMYTVG